MEQYGEQILAVIFGFIHAEKLERFLVDKANGKGGDGSNGNSEKNQGSAGNVTDSQAARAPSKQPAEGGRMLLPPIYARALRTKILELLALWGRRAPNHFFKVRPMSAFAHLSQTAFY